MSCSFTIDQRLLAVEKTGTAEVEALKESDASFEVLRAESVSLI